MANRIYRITFTEESGIAPVDVQTTIFDQLAFETALRKNRSWGDLKDNALRLTPFTAWNAAVRENKIAMPWEDFTRAAVAVELVEDDDEDSYGEPVEIDGEEHDELGKDTPTEA